MAEVLGGLMGSFTGTFSTITTGAYWFVAIGLVCFFAFAIFYWFFMFPVEVTILKKRAGGMFQKVVERARPIRNRSTKDIVCYKLRAMPFRDKKEIFPPGKDAIFVDKRGRPSFFVVENEAGDFEGLRFQINPSMMVSDERDAKIWYAQRHRENATKYATDNFLVKYGGMVSAGILLIVIVVFAIILMNEMSSVATALGGVASALKSVVAVTTAQASGAVVL